MKEHRELLARGDTVIVWWPWPIEVFRYTAPRDELLVLRFVDERP